MAKDPDSISTYKQRPISLNEIHWVEWFPREKRLREELRGSGFLLRCSRFVMKPASFSTSIYLLRIKPLWQAPMQQAAGDVLSNRGTICDSIDEEIKPNLNLCLFLQTRELEGHTVVGRQRHPASDLRPWKGTSSLNAQSCNLLDISLFLSSADRCFGWRLGYLRLHWQAMNSINQLRHKTLNVAMKLKSWQKTWFVNSFCRTSSSSFAVC